MARKLDKGEELDPEKISQILKNPLELFVPVISDLPLRDQRDTMERPFFSLSKKKRRAPIDYKSEDGSVWIHVMAHPEFGMATIWDADILIWAASVIMERHNSKLNDSSRRLEFSPHELLRAIRRSIGGEHYQRLREALARLQATVIRTNIRAKSSRKDRQFSWIDSFEDLVDENTGESRGMALELSDWFYEGIVEKGGVLAIGPEYFDITGGRERWLYRVARKHAGGHEGEGFAISLPTLFDKSGAEGAYRRFKFELKKIAEANDLPEFHLAWEERERGEPSLRMTRRSMLTIDHPGYEAPKRRIASRKSERY
jgi:plasmid replication initiation protein